MPKLPQNVLSLKQFMLRRESLKLYRDILRAIKHIPEESHRKELLAWARSDFESNKHHQDEEVIKMCQSRGRLTLKEIETSLRLAHLKK